MRRNGAQDAVMNDRDKADLERADQMMRDGKALRARVMTRIRQRRWRERQSERREKGNG